MLAAVGVGWFDTLKDCVEQFVVYEKEYSPDPKAAESYQDFYKLYHQVYAQTKELCEQLNELEQ